MFEKILIAIGNSSESQEVLAAGLTLAEKLGAKILLLHVINSLTSTSFSPLVGGMFPIVNDIALEQYTKEWQESERQGLEQLQTYAAQAKERGSLVEISQNLGDSGRMICEVAKNWSADTIVMGRNQKSMLSEIWLGSTSNYVLHHAPCSVMVIQLPALAS
jgi:nucleotide-binding universal stress UspA family protein